MTLICSKTFLDLYNQGDCITLAYCISANNYHVFLVAGINCALLYNEFVPFFLGAFQRLLLFNGTFKQRKCFQFFSFIFLHRKLF